MLKKLIEKIVPAYIRNKRRKYLLHRLKNEIVEYLKNSSECGALEKNEIINYLTSNPLAVFPYDFTKKYNPKNLIVYTDGENMMKYVWHENKRLYFKKSWKEKWIKKYYNSILLEQDIDSPHRYETADFHVEENDVVVDVGVAEGNFALSAVEKAKKIYLFEVDEEWIDALKLTFAPWKDKVEIACKYVSDNDDGSCITLDTFLGKEKVDFIKADVEGAEVALLKGSRNILSSADKMKVIMCTYHNQNDAEEIDHMLKALGFSAEFSKGHMIFFIDKLAPPYLRRGLIRAKNLSEFHHQKFQIC